MNKAEEFYREYFDLEDCNLQRFDLEGIECMQLYADEQSREEALRYGEHIIKSHIFKKPPLKYDKWKSNQEEQ